jgi:zinc protease
MFFTLKKYSVLIFFTFVIFTYPLPSNAQNQIKHWVTEKGINVFFLEAQELPILDMRLLFDAGSSRDSDSKGLSYITHSLLDEGAAGLDAIQIAEKFDEVGAQFSAASSLDQSNLSLRTLTKKHYIQQALNVFMKILAKPDFTAADIELLRNRIIISIREDLQDPGFIAQKTFYKELYGDHPYGNTTKGEENSVSRITREEIVGFYQKYLVASNSTLVMVGAVSEEEAMDIAKLFDQSMHEGKKPAALVAPKPDLSRRTIRVSFPSKQAHILMGHLGLKRGGKGYFPTYLANHILGGSGFSSRIMNEVRLKRGLAYSAYSYLFPLKHKGPYIIGLQTEGKNIDTAIDIIEKTVNSYVADGPSTNELQHSIESITNGFPLRISSNASMLNYISMISYYGLPLDYLDTFQEKFKSIKMGQVLQAIKNNINLSSLITVVVGGEESKK